MSHLEPTNLSIRLVKFDAASLAIVEACRARLQGTAGRPTSLSEAVRLIVDDFAARQATMAPTEAAATKPGSVGRLKRGKAATAQAAPFEGAT